MEKYESGYRDGIQLCIERLQESLNWYNKTFPKNAAESVITQRHSLRFQIKSFKQLQKRLSLHRFKPELKNRLADYSMCITCGLPKDADCHKSSLPS